VVLWEIFFGCGCTALVTLVTSFVLACFLKIFIRHNSDPTPGYGEAIPVHLGMIPDFSVWRDMHPFGDNGLLNPGMPADYHIFHDNRFFHQGPTVNKHVVRQHAVSDHPAADDGSVGHQGIQCPTRPGIRAPFLGEDGLDRRVLTLKGPDWPETAIHVEVGVYSGQVHSSRHRGSQRPASRMNPWHDRPAFP